MTRKNLCEVGVVALLVFIHPIAPVAQEDSTTSRPMVFAVPDSIQVNIGDNGEMFLRFRDSEKARFVKVATFTVIGAQDSLVQGFILLGDFIPVTYEYEITFDDRSSYTTTVSISPNSPYQSIENLPADPVTLLKSALTYEERGEFEPAFYSYIRLQRLLTDDVFVKSRLTELFDQRETGFESFGQQAFYRRKFPLLKYYREAMRYYHMHGDEDNALKYTNKILEIIPDEQEALRYQKQIAGGWLNITTRPVESDVYLNGVKTGKTPFREQVPEGYYTIEIRTDESYLPVLIQTSVNRKRENRYEISLFHIPDNMVLIPEGYFLMGSDLGKKNEQPEHRGYLDWYFIDKYEVPNGQYKRFVLETNYRQPYHWFNMPYGKENTFPVVFVSWTDAFAYAEWAGKRLPTEAEWEKAARGGKISMHYPWGDDWDSSRVHFNAKDIIEVGQYSPNGFGLYDMIGNVWEWVADRYKADYYKNSPEENPIGPARGNNYILRGGSYKEVDPQSLRIATRVPFFFNKSRRYIGFRCAKDAPDNLISVSRDDGSSEIFVEYKEADQ